MHLQQMQMDHSQMDHSQMDHSQMAADTMSCCSMDGSGGHIMAGIPDFLYYSSIIIIMILSFTLFEIARRKEGVTGKAGKIELTKFGFVKSFFMSRKIQFSIQSLFVLLFIVILFSGFYGNPQPGENIAPILTWNIWWVGLIFLILILGKMWCYACPWDAVTSWLRRLSVFKIRKHERFNLGWKWPKYLRNIYPAAVFFILLTWLELGFHVTMNPERTAYLGLLMFGLVFVPGLLFEKKSFCRYGCLVGRISGLYAMFSPVEIRNKNQKICNDCRTYDCFTGNNEGYACPTNQNLKTMKSNTYCIMCAECFRTCKYDNVAFNVRPFSTDLIETARPRKDEAYLAMILFALTAFHGLTMTPNWKILIQAIQDSLSIGYIAAFSIGMAVCIAAPILVYYGFVWLSKWFSGAKDIPVNDLFIKYSYGVIPIALFYHLAHNVEHFFMESQKLAVLASDPFGWDWNLFGTANVQFASIFSLGTIWYMQVVLIIIGHVFGLYVSHRHAYSMFNDRKKAIRSQIPMILLMVIFSLISLWLVAQPMEMRTAM
ncbi:MAG: 4Fe-4S binding protein [bacterium]|nr:4Fe-4S binding protein [bacterium]